MRDLDFDRHIHVRAHTKVIRTPGVNLEAASALILVLLLRGERILWEDDWWEVGFLWLSRLLAGTEQAVLLEELLQSCFGDAPLMFIAETVEDLCTAEIWVVGVNFPQNWEELIIGWNGEIVHVD